ncbi:hypothetical protein KFL_001180240 [Klebsormidium nitens]|uniref:Transcription and mRNA export factor ENY2 n=1 Tax=Klebsormidium nitens TaxID=105231 RepID=A0A1Y1HVJ9_KLENI|nr:hypothetical protein KFL_001180240 [Klebsormidium nitens]|eukprot:GAQ82645.1 hypothetical protein KFL_001180240 [Klebsormidium nitens]
MMGSITRPPTPPSEEEEGLKAPTIQDIVNMRLIQSGEKERLKELLRERLVECGWKDDLIADCRKRVREAGRGAVTIDNLVKTITPKGRATVPASVKAELLQRIRSFLDET